MLKNKDDDRSSRDGIESTTIIAIRSPDARNAVVASDGQATMEDTVVKNNTNKVRVLYGGNVLAGFAGSTADAMTLFDKFEGKLEQYSGKLERAAVELTKEWRTDKILRKLEALMVVVNSESLLLISGAGDVLRPDHNVIGIGSGGSYALAAARALLEHSQLNPEEVARESLLLTSTIDVYTNDQLSVETIEW
uniref:20S proteasome A and B subunits n=1 Tax=uncultured organism TaxID=155900 RepID=M1QAB3_9ZZZZ|nr:20S proteasome A and B subunits [uncultured organism]